MTISSLPTRSPIPNSCYNRLRDVDPEHWNKVWIVTRYDGASRFARLRLENDPLEYEPALSVRSLKTLAVSW
jgi:hypothetical protein